MTLESHATPHLKMRTTTLITSQAEKLNVIGAHFAATNTQNANLGREHLSRIVNNKIHSLKNELATDEAEGKTVTNFSDRNTALYPSDRETEKYMTSQAELASIFKKLNNKKSAGYDGIPNIVLKHLPQKIVNYYCIIFKNALNNTYFPNSWKTAKVIALLKKK